LTPTWWMRARESNPFPCLRVEPHITVFRINIENLEAWIRTFIKAEFVNDMVTSIHKGLEYVRSTLPVHLREKSSCASHCITYQLSLHKLEGTSFAVDDTQGVKCDHEHTHMCTHCEDILNTVFILCQDQTRWKTCSDEDRACAGEDLKVYQDNFTRLWSHVVRGELHEIRKALLIKELKPNQCFVNFDYAMSL